MKTRLRNILTRIHFVLLTISVLNSVVKNFTTYNLEGSIAGGIWILVAISGLTLFFLYLKPFKKINFYFSFYALITTLSIIALVFRSFFLGFILMVILYPAIPDQKEYEKDGFIISTPFQGIMSRCCPYEIKERRLLILEKNYGKWEAEGPIDFETLKIDSYDNEIEIIYSTDFDKGVIKKKKIKKYGS